MAYSVLIFSVYIKTPAKNKSIVDLGARLWFDGHVATRFELVCDATEHNHLP